MNALLRKALGGVAAVALLALGATDAHATHFRYGTLRWEVVSQNDLVVNIKITHESAWRRSYSWGATPTIGVPLTIPATSIVIQKIPSGTQLFSTPMVVTPSAINTLEDWFVGSGQISTSLLRADLPVRIFWQGNARISFFADGNDDRPFRVESVMSATPNLASPASSILPIITVAHPLPAAKFFIAAADVDGDTLTWSIAPPARSLLVKERPDGADNIPTPINFDIDPATGEVTWDTSQEAPPVPGCNPPSVPCTELFAVQFLVTDSKGAETPVDAFLRLVPNQGVAPQALINGSAAPHLVSVRPNNPVSFTLTGVDGDPGATVTLTSGALPPGASMTPSLPTAGPGNAPGTSSTFNWTPTPAQAGNVFVVPFAVTDNFGIQSTNSAHITVLENFAPTVTCPAPTTFEATGPSGATGSISASVADPDGDGLTVEWYVDTVLVKTETVPPGSGATVTLDHSYSLGTHAVRIVVDDTLLTAECTTSVTVDDTTPPVVTVPADITEEAVGSSGNVVTFTATAFDIVDGALTPTCAPPSGSTFPLGSTTVTCTATDAHGNTGSASFLVNIVDTTAPVVTVPANMTLEATGPAGAVATFTATAFDIVDGPLTPTCVPASGSTFPLDVTTTVTCSATDSHGNTGTATFTIAVVDTTPPVISDMPANMVLEATGPSGAVASWPPPSAVDIVDGNVTVVCAPASGSTFALDVTTTVTCTATDAHGNAASETFTVRVQDTTPPVISNMPANMTVSATGPSGAIVTWPPPTAVDIVDGSVPVVCVPPSGSQFPMGTTTVTCTATDAHANASSASFTVTVVDNTPPPVSVTLSPGILWPPNHKMVRIQVDVQTEPGAECAIVSVTSNEPVEGQGDGNRPYDWLFNGLNLQLRAERQGPGSSRIYTVTVRCVDDNNNEGFGTATAVVPHDMGTPGLQVE